MKLVTVTGDLEREPTVAAALALRADVELVLRCVDRVELLASIRGGGLDAIVFVGVPSWLDRQTIEEARSGHARLVAVVSDPDEADRLSAAGAALMLPDATADEIVEQCSRTDEFALPIPPTAVQEQSAPGKVIVLWGPKGSPGRTSLAIELTAELAKVHPSTLLVDADTYGGDVAQLLGIAEELPTIVWAAQLAAKEELWPDRLAVELRRAGGNGPVVLPGLSRSDLWPEISEFGLRQLVEVARSSFEYSIFDVGFCLEPETTIYPTSNQGRNAVARHLVAVADQVVAVARADALGIKHFLWSYEQVSSLCDPAHIRIVANRVGSRREWEVAELIKRHTGKRPFAYVPDVPSDFARAVAAAVPVGVRLPRSAVCTSTRRLAAGLGGGIRPRGLLTRMSGRS